MQRSEAGKIKKEQKGNRRKRTWCNE